MNPPPTSNTARLPAAPARPRGPHPAVPLQGAAREDGAVGNHRKRPRASQACEACRERKTKCDQQCPCSRCAYYDLECVYRQVERVRRRRTRDKGGLQLETAPNGISGLPKPRQLIQRPPEPLLGSDIEPRQPFSGPPGQHADSDMEPRESAQRSPEPLLGGTSGTNFLGDDTNFSVEEAVASHDQDVGQGRTREAEVSNVGTPRLDGLNTHTTGTEFYGGSSNLAFLAKLFSEARKRANTLSHKESPSGMEASPATTQSITASELRHLNDNMSSLVDLMYNTDYQSPITHRTGPRNEKSTPQINDNVPMARIIGDGSDVPREAAGSQAEAPTTNPSNGPMHAPSLEPEVDTVEVEKIFVAAYFNNKHYIHPMLEEKSFEHECQEQVWNNPSTGSSRKCRTQFLSLYYAVVALGAINGGPDENAALGRLYQDARRRRRQGGRELQVRRSALDWASHYFDLAKEALGDIMEVSSLETCQTLFMMTVFCQNALKPHACYMYSGNAVRTALALGLAHKARSTDSEEIRRTWWCIYSHEIEMCCSSGRLDSLMAPEHYSLPIPGKTEDMGMGHRSEAAIIAIMVDLARILKRASTDISFNAGGRSIGEMSQIGHQLNQEIEAWKANLPPPLNFDTESLNDPVWAHKQKVVLKMRYYNARILINRRFIVASSSSSSSSSTHNSVDLTRHVDICLDAARKTILLIHSAFVNRIYLRTWWYCTTYTLYANMIILYLVLTDSHSVRGEELIADVEKSLEIFNAMKQVVVAQRCAELTKEMLTVAKKHQQELRDGQKAGRRDHLPDAMDAGANVPAPDNDDLWDDVTAGGLPATTLSQSLPGWDWNEGLAQLYDPGVLEEVAFSGGGGKVDGSLDIFADFTAGSNDERAITGPTRGIFEPFEGDVFSGQQFSDWA